MPTVVVQGSAWARKIMSATHLRARKSLYSKGYRHADLYRVFPLSTEN